MRSSPTVSLITVVLNDRAGLARTLASAFAPEQPAQIEAIVIDGGSTDGSVAVLQAYADRLAAWRSGPDRGPFDAINKGLALANGDIVGLLHAGDKLAHPRALDPVLAAFEASPAEIVYGDCAIFKPNGKLSRYWRAGTFTRAKFRRGWFPPHPSFYVRRHLFEYLGGYRCDLPIAADYELMLRFLYVYGAQHRYVARPLVHMAAGGQSNATLAHRLQGIRECRCAWQIHQCRPSPGFGIYKPARRIHQFLLPAGCVPAPRRDLELVAGTR